MFSVKFDRTEPIELHDEVAAEIRRAARSRSASDLPDGLDILLNREVAAEAHIRLGIRT